MSTIFERSFETFKPSGIPDKQSLLEMSESTDLNAESQSNYKFSSTDFFRREMALGNDSSLRSLLQIWEKHNQECWTRLCDVYNIDVNTLSSVSLELEEEAGDHSALRQFADILDLKSRVATELQALEELRKELEDSEAVGEVHLKLESFQKENASLNKKIDEFRNKLWELAQYKVAKDQELEDMREQHEETINTLKAKHADEIKALRRTYEDEKVNRASSVFRALSQNSAFSSSGLFNTIGGGSGGDKKNQSYSSLQASGSAFTQYTSLTVISDDEYDISEHENVPNHDEDESMAPDSLGDLLDDQPSIPNTPAQVDKIAFPLLMEDAFSGEDLLSPSIKIATSKAESSPPNISNNNNNNNDHSHGNSEAPAKPTCVDVPDEEPSLCLSEKLRQLQEECAKLESPDNLVAIDNYKAPNSVENWSMSLGNHHQEALNDTMESMLSNYSYDDASPIKPTHSALPHETNVVKDSSLSDQSNDSPSDFAEVIKRMESDRLLMEQTYQNRQAHSENLIVQSQTELEEMHSLLQSERMVLKEQKEDLQAQLLACQRQLRSLERFVEEQTRDREVEREDFEKELAALRIQRQQLQQAIREKRNSESPIPGSLVDEELKELRQKREELEIVIGQRNAQIENLEKSMKQNEPSDHSVSVERFKLELSVSQAEVESLRAAYDSLNQHHVDLQNDYDTVQAMLDEKQVDLDEIQKEYMDKIQDIQNQQEEQIRAYEERISHLQSQLTLLKSELKQLTSEKDDLLLEVERQKSLVNNSLHGPSLVSLEQNLTDEDNGILRMANMTKGATLLSCLQFLMQRIHMDCEHFMLLFKPPSSSNAASVSSQWKALALLLTNQEKENELLPVLTSHNTLSEEERQSILRSCQALRKLLKRIEEWNSQHTFRHSPLMMMISNEEHYSSTLPPVAAAAEEDWRASLLFHIHHIFRENRQFSGLFLQSVYDILRWHTTKEVALDFHWRTVQEVLVNWQKQQNGALERLLVQERQSLTQELNALKSKLIEVEERGDMPLLVRRSSSCSRKATDEWMLQPDSPDVPDSCQMAIPYKNSFDKVSEMSRLRCLVDALRYRTKQAEAMSEELKICFEREKLMNEGLREDRDRLCYNLEDLRLRLSSTEGKLSECRETLENTYRDSITYRNQVDEFRRIAAHHAMEKEKLQNQLLNEAKRVSEERRKLSLMEREFNKLSDRHRDDVLNLQRKLETDMLAAQLKIEEKEELVLSLKRELHLDKESMQHIRRNLLSQPASMNISYDGLLDENQELRSMNVNLEALAQQRLAEITELRREFDAIKQMLPTSRSSKSTVNMSYEGKSWQEAENERPSGKTFHHLHSMQAIIDHLLQDTGVILSSEVDSALHDLMNHLVTLQLLTEEDCIRYASSQSHTSHDSGDFGGRLSLSRGPLRIVEESIQYFSLQQRNAVSVATSAAAATSTPVVSPNKQVSSHHGLIDWEPLLNPSTSTRDRAQLLQQLATLRVDELQEQILYLVRERMQMRQMIDSLECFAMQQQPRRFRNHMEKDHSLSFSDHAKSSDPYSNSDSIPLARYQQIYLRCLRAESRRRALTYQKRYLLLALGGFNETEAIILRSLARAGLGASHTDSTRMQPLSLSIDPILTPRARFRGFAYAIIALFRMRFLVRKWRVSFEPARSQNTLLNTSNSHHRITTTVPPTSRLSNSTVSGGSHSSDRVSLRANQIPIYTESSFHSPKSFTNRK